MEQYTLKKPEYVKTRSRKGRGPASGLGKTAGRGMNGQMSRSGSKKRAWFEGGQMPLQRRVPKRGFNNIFKITNQVLNLSTIEKVGLTEITPEILEDKGIIDNSKMPVKILGVGEVTKAIKITADAFSSSSKEKIEKAGGEVLIREINKKTKEDTKVDNG